MYIYILTHTHIYIYTYSHTHTHTHIYIYICVHTHIHVCCKCVYTCNSNAYIPCDECANLSCCDAFKHSAWLAIKHVNVPVKINRQSSHCDQWVSLSLVLTVLLLPTRNCAFAVSSLHLPALAAGPGRTQTLPGDNMSLMPMPCHRVYGRVARCIGLKVPQDN